MEYKRFQSSKYELFCYTRSRSRRGGGGWGRGEAAKTSAVIVEYLYSFRALFVLCSTELGDKKAKCIISFQPSYDG